MTRAKTDGSFACKASCIPVFFRNTSGIWLQYFSR